MCFFCCCCFPGCCDFLDRIECNLFRSNLKIIHLLYIGISILLFIFLISTMSIISWGKLPSINLTLFIILLLILVACMIFSCLIIYWKSNTTRQNEMKEKIELLSKIGLILSIVSIIVFFLEIIFISVGFSQAKTYYPCSGDGEYELKVKVYVGFFVFKKNDNSSFILNNTNSEYINESIIINRRLISGEDEDEYECYQDFLTSAVYGMTYFTFIISEILNIAGVCFFSILGKSDDCYTFHKNEKSNQNSNQPIINIQSPQVIVINQINNNINTINNANSNNNNNCDTNNTDKNNQNNQNNQKNQNSKRRDLPMKVDEGNNINQNGVNQQNNIENKNKINFTNLPIDSKNNSKSALDIDKAKFK